MEEINLKVLTAIRTRYGEFSKAHKRIADVILSDYKEVITMSISDIARKAETSETTIMRFLKEIGFDSYQLFKVSLAQEIVEQPSNALYEDIEEGDSINQIKQKIIHSTTIAIEDIDKLNDEETIRHVVDSFERANKIFFFGVGASGAIALDAFHKFLRLGLNVGYSSDSHLMSIMCSHAGENDLIFAVSHSGESREIIDAITLAKDKGAKIISMTSYQNSTLAKLSDITLLSSTRETKYRPDAMTSRIVQCAIIDIVYVVFALRMGPKAIEKVNISRLAVAKKKK
jgi:DNA-binding MurR/RpiR family transcriptional regulator